MHSEDEQSLRPVVWFLLTSVFVVHLASYMVIPFMMVLLPMRLGISVALASVIVFVIKISVKLSSVIGGPLGDRFGTKPLLVVGMVLRGVGMAAFSFNQHVWWLFAASLTAGLGNGLYSPPTRAALSFLSPASSKRRVFSARAVAANLGMALAPVVVFFLVKGYANLVFIGAGALFLVFAVVTSIWLPDLPTQKEASLTQIVREMAKDRKWLVFSLLAIGSWFLYGQIDSNIVVWTDSLYGVAGMTVTAALFALFVAALQMTETRFGLARSLSPGQYVVVGTGLLSLALVVVSALNSLVGAGISVFVFAAGATLLAPGQDLVTADMAVAGSENTYFAAATLSSSVGTAISAPMGVLLIRQWHTHAPPWLVMAGAGVVVTLMLFVWTRNGKLARGLPTSEIA